MANLTLPDSTKHPEQADMDTRLLAEEEDGPAERLLKTTKVGRPFHNVTLSLRGLIVDD